MPPKGSKTKKAAGMAQPTLSFKNRKPSLPSPSKKKSTAPSRQSSLRQSISTDDIHPPRPTSPSPTPVALRQERQRKDEEDDNEKTDVEDETFVIHSQVLKKVEEGRRLDVKSKEWEGAMRGVREAMGGMAPIHAGPDTHNNVHHILRVFDMTSKYGPCVGMSRLQRWERAKKWGLNPPDEIRDILTTVEGREDVSYRENVLHGWV